MGLYDPILRLPWPAGLAPGDAFSIDLRLDRGAWELQVFTPADHRRAAMTGSPRRLAAYLLPPSGGRHAVTFDRWLA